MVYYIVIPNERTAMAMNKNLPMEVTGKMSIGEKIKRFFSLICRNDVTVSRTGEIFHMPILAFLIIALLTFKISVIAILISLICGVEYTIDGEDIPNPRKISFRPKN